MKVLIFLRQTERKDESNWKIDTISVVQELIVKSMALRHETFTIEVPEKFLHLINRLFWAIL